MKKFLAILLILCTAAFGQDKKETFVVSISPTINDKIAENITPLINRAVLRSELYTLLPNDNELRKTLKKAWKGNLVDDQVIIDFAKSANVDNLCLARISKTVDNEDQIALEWVKLKTVPIEYGDIGIAQGKLNKETIDSAVKDMFEMTKRNSGKSGNIKSFTDSRDGKQYKMVTIGEQVWMAENLNYNASGSKCYDNDENNCKKYGRLYDWETAKKVCPNDWHLRKGEWLVLVNFAGGEIAGKKLKAAKGWIYDDNGKKTGNGTYEFGFSALPGGYGSSGGNFKYVGSHGFWWSASESSSGTAYERIMYYDDERVQWYDYGDKGYLQSVRCLQD